MGFQRKSTRVFYSGDTGYHQQFKEIGDRYGPFDLTLIESGQYNLLWRKIHQLPEEAVQAHIDLKGKYMIPVHWAMFELAPHDWFEPINRATAAAKEKGVAILTPKIGDLVSVGQQQQTFARWWEEAAKMASVESQP